MSILPQQGMRTEQWSGYPIRFVQHDGEWVCASVDVATALNYRDAANMLRHVPDKYKGTHLMSTPGGEQKLSTLTEFGIYKAVFGSHKPEAQEFQEWVFTVIKRLREATGIEGFGVFRMMDKQHQRAADARLDAALPQADKVDHIKANVIADKATSNIYGHDKMLKKGAMSPEMLRTRQPILDDTVNLMAMQSYYGLNDSISRTIYKKHHAPQEAANGTD